MWKVFLPPSAFPSLLMFCKLLPVTIPKRKILCRATPCFWVAHCLLGFFGFLHMHAGKFTTTCTLHFIQANIKLGVTGSDGQANALHCTLQVPMCFQIHIRCSMTDPFRIGCDISIVRGSDLVCPVIAMGDFLTMCGPSPLPFFVSQMVVT